MTRLNPAKLHVRFDPGVTADGPAQAARRYTLTHSDATGELFLTVASDYDRKQISGWYTRLMRDEVLAEWQPDEPALHVYCHVSGGLVFGSAEMRDSIFRRELPLVLQAIRYGDRAWFQAEPDRDQAPIYVHFQAAHRRYARFEQWGTGRDYRISDPEPNTDS